MNYDDFDAEYRRVLGIADELPTDALAREIERLRVLAGGLADVADRRRAGNGIAMLDDILGYDEQPAASPAMAEAERAHALASADGGTDEERIARAEAGMAEISRIAQTADPSERTAILALNESLYMLILALRPDA
ncbi:hypothetical protein [Kribbella shirazensis]|uniref:Uncharacterized protein n=1 Tax=Kribbella shirazensis TaxID=1105143 RepID=A0A7X5V6X1_9ACTN|nr:hypothetical protein [Kribbella shirazensis]NIK55057.1 hypothetical protein [Kribbella shirazensis]